MCVLQDDAQIGVDVLGWKQTITGVGHCRQVGCPESGINEAVQRLAGLGYKVPSEPAECAVMYPVLHSQRLWAMYIGPPSRV